VKKNQKSSVNCFGITYTAFSNIALEDAGVDLHIDIDGIYSPTLEVACDPPGIGATN
jgi:hypothetical protein